MTLSDCEAPDWLSSSSSTSFLADLGAFFFASLDTVAEWVRHGCTIYDCGDIQNVTTRRVLSDLEDHECNPLATTRSLMAEWAAMRGITAPESGCGPRGVDSC